MLSTIVRSICVLPLLAVLATLGQSAEVPPTRASLKTAHNREVAPNFELRDSSGRNVNLLQHRAKVLLLDFWATYCGGCKKELPWFADFERTYQRRGFRVVAVALDEDGWNVVNPFLQSQRLALRVALGKDDLISNYGVKEIPTAFLIDRKGRIAATYIGLVDRADIESNIAALLAER